MKSFLIWALMWLTVPAALAADTWWKLDADAVTIYTDSSARKAQSFAQIYDAMATLTQEFLGRDGYASPRPLVVLFRRERDVETVFGSVRLDVDEEILQRSIVVDGRLIIGLAVAAEDESEIPANPNVIAAFGRAMPWWMETGLQMVVQQRLGNGDLDYQGWDKKTFTERWADDEVTAWNDFWMIAGLPGTMTEQEDITAAQARAWGLMSWMMDGEEGPARVQRFLKLLQEKSPAEALKDLAGMELEGLKVPVLRVVRNRKRRVEVRDWYDRRKAISDYHPVELPNYERLALWSDAAAAGGREGDAQKAYREAVGLAPDALAVIELTARRKFQAGDLAGAYASYREAVQQGTGNAWAHLSVASWQLQQLGTGEAHPLAEIRDLAQRAIALNPGMDDAITVLGTIGLVSPQPDSAVMMALDDRVGPDRTGQWARLYRAALRARAGEIEAGLADLEQVLRDPAATPDFHTRALQQWGLLALPELQQSVKSALAAGDLKAAIAAVDAAQAADSRPLAREACLQLRLQLEQVAAQPGP